ncbi:MAG: hypothetical protein KatS3mg110_3218 [Pirellulaceae bacterium]|nr:MAG: hypothetical protein KatS3mg110_3218 [Pirellulaceae bacterium]
MATCDFHTCPLETLPVAVIDFETTGLDASTDRVVEVAVVHTDGFGRAVTVLQTLINPGQPIDPRATEIHGIADKDVQDAPRFADIVIPLMDSLNNRLVAAYNAPFDMRFLMAELGRVGITESLPALCIMELGQVLLARPRRRLETACREMKVPFRNGHRAADDALAAACLLHRYLRRMREAGYGTLATFHHICRHSLVRYYGQPLPPRTPRPRQQETASSTEWESLQVSCATLNDDLQRRLEAITSILVNGLQKASPLDWGRWMVPLDFDEPPPTAPTIQRPDPPAAELKPRPEERPDPNSPKYQVAADVADTLFPWRLEKKRQLARQAYETDVRRYNEKVSHWNALVLQYREQLELAKRQYQQRWSEYQQALAAYQERQRRYKAHAVQHNSHISAEKEGYFRGDPACVEKTMMRTLASSQLPDDFPTACHLSYDSETRILSVVRMAPRPDVIPQVKSYRPLKKEMTVKEVPMPTSERNRLYDNMVYQLVLRTLHEMFVADTARLISAVQVRIAVEGYDPATGHPALLVLARLTASREQYHNLRLETVDPQECFKALGGVTKARPSALRPIESLRDDQ